MEVSGSLSSCAILPKPDAPKLPRKNCLEKAFSYLIVQCPRIEMPDG